MQKISSPTEEIEKVLNKSSDTILLKDLMDAMQASGFGLIMLFFSLAVVIPIPPPYPTVMSIPILVFSSQMMLGYTSPKLPRKLYNKRIKRSILAAILKKSSPYLSKIEKIVKPRLSFMLTGTAEKVIGAFFLLFSSFIFLPLPFSNFIPGVGILISSIGLVYKDGIAIISGLIVGITGITISIFLSGFIVVKSFSFIKGLFN